MTASAVSPFIPDGHTLTALLIVICFSSGLNVYATVAMLGLLSHFTSLYFQLHCTSSKAGM